MFKKISASLKNISDKKIFSSVCFCLKQAGEYYAISKKCTLLTKPLPLFYGMVNLGKILGIIFFGKEPADVLHGLTVRVVEETLLQDYNFLEEIVQVKEKGAFPNFHKCFSQHPIKPGTRFTLFELFNEIPEIKKLLNGKKENSILIPEASIHYILMFVLSMISRYEPKKWEKIINEEKEIVEKFLKISFNKFPKMIEEKLNERFIWKKD